MTDTRGQTAVPRTRTFTGCRTCRDRHLKCDEAKPTCSSCLRLNMKCEGYAPRLLWMSQRSESGPDGDRRSKGSSYRFLLFSDDVREKLSHELIQSLGHEPLDRVVSHLGGITLPDFDSDHHSIGPFGVFRAFEDPDGCSEQHSTSSKAADDDTSPSAVDSGFQDMTSIEELLGTGDDLDCDLLDTWQQDEAPMPTDTGIEAAVPQEEQGSSNLDNMGMSSMLISHPGSPFSPFSFNLPTTTVINNNPIQGQSTPPNEHSDNNNGINNEQQPHQNDVGMPRLIDAITPAIPMPIVTNSLLPAHADHLLRYFKIEVLGRATALYPSRISPWKELLLPCALETYAELSLWSNASHTRMSILCTILAKTAYHLHLSARGDAESASHWYLVAVQHQQRGQQHLKRALATEIDGTNRAKYAETLMAILGAGFVLMYFDGPERVKKLVIDAERLIRLRGLPFKKSYKLRVLHHMYTHLRVVMESTNMTKSSSFTSESAQVGSSLVAPMPTRTFRVAEMNLGKADYLRIKPDEMGYNDIHLEEPGDFPMTMFPEIYGVPESLLSLHAHTISLANEKPELEKAALRNPEIRSALGKHIKSLEQQIWSWSPGRGAGPERPWSLITADTPSFTNDERLPRGFQQALIIYFYRRVYNMSALLLQDGVRKTLDYVQPYLELVKYDQDFGITIAWTLFVAACEAVTPELQERSIEYLEALDHCGIFVETSKPSETAQTVWRRREESGDFSFSWPDLTS